MFVLTGTVGTLGGIVTRLERSGRHWGSTVVQSLKSSTRGRLELSNYKKARCVLEFILSPRKERVPRRPR